LGGQLLGKAGIRRLVVSTTAPKTVVGRNTIVGPDRTPTRWLPSKPTLTAAL